MQKWQVELHNTPIWLFNTFLGIFFISIILLLLVSKTKFGKQFWLITRPCLSKRSLWKIGIVLAVMLLLLLTEIRLNVLNTFFYNGLYSSLQDMNATLFWFFALINAGVVILRTINDSVNELLDETLAIHWSKKLNDILTHRWLKGKNFYHLQSRYDSPDNVDQRIQQDAQDFIRSTITFIRGMLNSVISTLEFTLVLWGLSGVLDVFGYEIPRGIVFFVFIFVLVSTFLAVQIGKPLIRYNFENEKLNGDYRYSLIRIREHAESIAFYGGEQKEQQQLSQRFKAIINNRWRIVFQSIGLSSFNSLLTQGVQLLPLMLQAPRFFAGQIKIGDMHQTVQAFNRLQRSLSFFRNFYEQFTLYQARIERLSGFMQSIQQVSIKDDCLLAIEKNNNLLRLQGLTLYRHGVGVLFKNLNFCLKQGDSLLIKGASGCGKTSLMRALAGLWSFGVSGNVICPERKNIMFVPQRPYVPQGSLRDAIYYPNDSMSKDLCSLLTECQLAHLVDRLDEEADWQHILSPGELQRIAFVRILLCQPILILLDESTSALDEPTEAHLYGLMQNKLPQSIVVSIGHRSTLQKFHRHSLVLQRM